MAVSLILSLSPLSRTPGKVKSSKKNVKKCKDLIPPAAVHCIPQLKQRPVGHSGKALALRRSGKNGFQTVPLLGFFDFPAVQVQMGNASMLLDMVQGIEEMSLPIGGALVSMQEIYHPREIPLYSGMPQLNEPAVGVGMGAKSPEEWISAETNAD